MNICTHCTQAQIHNMKIVWWLRLHCQHHHTRNSDIIPAWRSSDVTRMPLTRVRKEPSSASDTITNPSDTLTRKELLTQWQRHFLSKREIFKDLAAPLLSPMFQRPCFYWHDQRTCKDPLYCDRRDPFPSVFILHPVSHLWCLSFHIQSVGQFSVQLFSCCLPTSVCPRHEDNLSQPSSLRVLPSLSFSWPVGWRLDATAHIPVHLQSDPQCSSPDRHVELVITSVLTLVNFGFSWQVHSPVFSSISLEKWGTTSDKKRGVARLCLLLIHNTSWHTEKEK